MTPRDGFIQVNGLRFHYLEWGSADHPPLVLLHGFGNQAHMWDLFAPTVAGRYHVFALDSRGHGDTDHAQEYGDELNVADTTAVINALGLQRLTLLGFSMGGGSAIVLASRRPELIERLVIVDRGPSGGEAGRGRMMRAISQARASFSSREEALAYIRLANPNRPEELVQRSLDHAFRALPNGCYELKYDQKLRERFLAGPAAGVDLWKCVETIDCPVLIVRGGNSDILLPEIAERMVQMLPQARLEVVPGAGHNVAQDQPDAFNAVVGAFLP